VIKNDRKIKWQKRDILAFLKKPDVATMESPSTAMVVQPPFVTLIVARKAAFAFTTDENKIRQFSIFAIATNSLPVHALREPGFTLDEAFPASKAKPYATRFWLFGHIIVITRVSDLSNLHIGLFMAQKVRFGSLKHPVPARIPAIIDLDMRHGKVAYLTRRMFKMDSHYVYYPIDLCVKTGNTFHGVIQALDLQRFAPHTFLGSVNVTRDED